MNIKEISTPQLIDQLWDKTIKYDETPEEKTELREQLNKEISAINRELNRRAR